jgi:hypothetical protein
MTVQIERALDEPIVRFIFDGRLDPETRSEALAETLGLLDELGVFFAIFDLRRLDATPDAFIDAFAPQPDGFALFDEPRIAPLLVTAELPPAGADDMPPRFGTIDDAIEFARVRFASRQPGDPLL